MLEIHKKKRFTFTTNSMIFWISGVNIVLNLFLQINFYTHYNIITRPLFCYKFSLTVIYFHAPPPLPFSQRSSPSTHSDFLPLLHPLNNNLSQ